MSADLDLAALRRYGKTVRDKVRGGECVIQPDQLLALLDRVERAEARAKAGELLATQILDLLQWMDALAERCDEGLSGSARASIGSLALTAASAKAEEIMAGGEPGEVRSEKYADELVRRTRELRRRESRDGEA